MEFPRTIPQELDPDEEDIEFQICDWYMPESDRAADHYRRKAGFPRIEGDPNVYDICMFGSTSTGDSVYVKVTGFEPYFFVKVPEDWQEKGKPYMNSKVKALENTLKFEKVQRTKINYETKKRETYMSTVIPHKLIDHLVSFKVIYRKEFWGFTNGELFPFIRVKVKSLALFNILKRYFIEPAQVALGLKSYESNIDPFLRFIHQRNIRPCGWVRLPAGRYKHLDCDEESGDAITRCGYNLTVDYNDVYSIDINKIAPLLIASFDIECSSSHGDFPVAKKDYRKLATDIIAAIKEDGSRLTKENILYWIRDAYKKDTYISSDVTINRLYTLDKVSIKTHVMPILEKHIDEIIRLISVASQVTYNEDEDECDGDGDENDVSKTKNNVTIDTIDTTNGTVVSKRKSGFNDDEDGPMGDLIKYFTKIKLPKLAGDKVIQIGTTVTRFGSDAVIYKNIITLNSCDAIEGAEVESYEAEDEVLMAWKELLKRLDPDILTGYNIFGFDMKYVWERAEELGIDEHFSVGLGRNNTRRTILDLKELTSSALGNNLMYFFDLDGVVSIDMYKVMQRDHKLDSYKLDNVASVFLGDKKDDISPAQIFSKFYGSSADRCEVARYCIQDCALVNRILSKLKVLENNVGMGNVCSVPLSYLFMRGQGIKIFSLVAKESRLNETLIPVIRNMDKDVIDDEGYEGAIVLDPQEGMYLEDPIVVLDYNSLYPSSMISRNLSHDSYVADPDSKYAKLQDQGITYQTVTYDVYEGKGDAKKVVGKRDCIFAQFPDGKKGIIPMILQNLLQQRKNTRKRMEYETLTLSDGRVAIGLVNDLGNGQLELLNVDKANLGVGFGGHKATIDASLVVERCDTYNKFEQAVLDALQLAYKVTANSLYGQTGSRTSPIYLKEIAACTTATGREMIYLAKNFVEEQYGAEVIYGDSVTCYTPVIIRHNNIIKIETIENLANIYGNNNWLTCKEQGKQDKEACEINDVESWTDAGWTKLYRVIRHTLVDSKKIIRINTHHGIVDVTDDHSLLRNDGTEVSPNNVNIGDALMHVSYPKPIITTCNISVDEARIMGFFCGDGSCGDYNCESGKKCSWALNNSDMNMLEMYRQLCENIYTDLDWCILNTIGSSGVYKLVPKSRNNYGGIKKIVTKYREMMYYQKAKIIPYDILNASIEIRDSFWKGLYDADGDKSNTVRIDQKNQISMACISYLASSLGYNISFNTRSDKSNIYRLNLTKGSQRKVNNTVKKKYNIDYSGYVYDLTTENHHFQAGIGEIIVHNTDSIFIKFKHNDINGNVVKGREALPLAIAAGQRVEKEIKAIMPNSQNLAYEKTLWPFIILSKKRYVGNLYEDNVNKFKQKSMGIVLKRRDNAPIVKTVYGGIIDTLLNKGDFLGSVEFLQSKLQEMVSGKVPLEDLIISKTLRASYKDPSKIAHKVLAKRMGERDAGNKPQANDRIPFVFIKMPDGVEVKLQGDRIEHPDYIRAECLTPDYYHYITNQLIKPITQIYALCVEKLPGYTFPPSYWEQMDIEMSDQKMYTDEKKRKKRIQALKQKEVVELLFDKYLDILKPNRNVRVYKKKHVLDLDPNESKTENNIIKEQFVINIYSNKLSEEEKTANKTANKNANKKGTTWKMVFELINATLNTQIYKEELFITNKKLIAYIRAAEYAFKYIYVNQTHIINEGKLCVKTDAAFITKWKSAYKNIHTLQEKLKNIIDVCDAGLLEELHELESIVNLIGFRDTIAYTLEAI